MMCLNCKEKKTNSTLLFLPMIMLLAFILVAAVYKFCLWFGQDKIVDLEVRGAINIVEACAQTESIEKIVFTSCLTAAIWRENICAEKDVDERSWSDREFCRKLKVWDLNIYILFFNYQNKGKIICFQ